MSKHSKHSMQVSSEPNGAVVAPESLRAEKEAAFNDEDVRQLAYSNWEARGHPEGSPKDDWIRATNDLRNRVLPAQSKTAGVA
jgi:hypothetical protein